MWGLCKYQYEWIVTLVIVLMVTIETARGLHKPHYIFVVNLMITDITSAVLREQHYDDWLHDWSGRFHCCNYCLPFKHRKIMKPHVIAESITVAWLFSALLYICVLFSDSYIYIKIDLCVNVCISHYPTSLHHQFHCFQHLICLAIKAYKEIWEEPNSLGNEVRPIQVIP